LPEKSSKENDLKTNVCTLILGAIFIKSKHTQRFCEPFHKYCPDFYQIKSFGGAVTPPPSTPVSRGSAYLAEQLKIALYWSKCHNELSVLYHLQLSL